MSRKGPKREARRMKRAQRQLATLPPCEACGAGWSRNGGRFEQQPHRPDCARTAAERAHAEAVRDAWAAGYRPAPPPERVRPKRTEPKGLDRTPIGEEDPWDENIALLSGMLGLAVPLWVQRFIDERWSIEQLMRLGPETANLLGPEGTALLFPSKPVPGRQHPVEGGEPIYIAPLLGTAGMFNAVAKGIAAASFVPGGIKFAGVHFESKQEWLQSGEAA